MRRVGDGLDLARDAFRRLAQELIELEAAQAVGAATEPGAPTVGAGRSRRPSGLLLVAWLGPALGLLAAALAAWTLVAHEMPPMLSGRDRDSLAGPGQGSRSMSSPLPSPSQSQAG
jgi:hypothetical protein